MYFGLILKRMQFKFLMRLHDRKIKILFPQPGFEPRMPRDNNYQGATVDFMTLVAKFLIL